MYKHILVGFDNSEDGKNALRRATELYSSAKDCKMTVAHAMQEPISFYYYTLNVPVVPIAGNTYPTQAPVNYEEQLPNTQQTLDDYTAHVIREAQSFLKDQGVTAEFELLGGSPTHDLCDFATENQVDLIVVGNSGKGALKKLLVGSVSENVMKNADMDVLIVK